jgi:hypothetical protein
MLLVILHCEYNIQQCNNMDVISNITLWIQYTSVQFNMDVASNITLQILYTTVQQCGCYY